MTSVNNRGSPIKPYKVHSGDTLTGIAAKNGTTVAALAKTNHIPNPDKIYTGQTLRFPDQFDPGRGVRSGGPENSTARAKDPLPAGVKRNIDTIDARIGDNNLRESSKLPSSPQISFPGPAVHINIKTSKPSSILGGDAFEYGKPSAPSGQPPPSAPGHGGKTRLNDTQQVTDTNSPTAHVKVPFYSQHEGGHGYEAGPTSCLHATVAMAADALGIKDHSHVLSYQHPIEMGNSTASGRLAVVREDAAKGRKYIDEQLNNKKPVIVGVDSHQGGHPINGDSMTDHYVIITGRGVDKDGKTYYAFNDPWAWPGGNQGVDTNPKNRFYPNENGGLTCKSSGTGSPYDLSQVRHNA